jgi:hypothetical protein
VSTENLQFRRYARPERIATDTFDTDTPFPFRTWVQSYQGIIPGEEYNLYNQYLTDWYKNNDSKKINEKVNIKLNYLKLLRQLQPFFKQEEVEQWYNSININNDKEVLLAIPFFAKKLKDIALYYYELRENIHRSKTKYNLVGTNTGLDLLLKNFLLANYTKRPNSTITIPAAIWRLVPDLSSVKDTINIEVEELYDFYNYLDHSPTIPVSGYYNLDTTEFTNYFNTLNLPVTSANWIYSTGIFNVSGNSFDFAEVVDTINISQEIVNKYLGSNKATVSIQTLSAQSYFFDVPIQRGNNFFYWPSGVYKSNIENLPRFDAQPLSSVGLESIATAGSGIQDSDTIFIKTKTGTLGAWLRLNEFDITNPSMRVEFEGDSVTRFKYPFPGYGLSANDIPWTGFGLSSDSRFSYLEQNLKLQIEKTYWSTAITLSSFTPIPLNSTTLVTNKAHPAVNFNFADKIRTWSEAPNYTEPVYSGPVKEAWMYKFTQTNISVASGEDNTILWPFYKIDSNLDYPADLPGDIYNQCLPVSLSSIKFDYATASNIITGADTFYKIQNYQSSSQDATECAWLSGKTIYYPETNITAVIQPSLNAVFQSGQFTKFLWQGENNTNCNVVFKDNKHQEDCEYLLNSNNTYNNFKSCTCKQVLFTPLGHPGNNFYDNGRFCDFIIEDTTSNDNFDLNNWKDSNGDKLLSSNNFAWYKTSNKISWGDGVWKTGPGDDGLLLKTGKTYFYYRQNLKDVNLEDESLPEYVVRYSYDNYFGTQPTEPNFKWIIGQKNNTAWLGTTTETNFTIYPSDLLIYSRQPQNTFTISKSAIQSQIISENRGSLWTNFDYLTINANNNEQQFILNYPSNLDYTTTETSQIPNLKFPNLVEILMWSVSSTTGRPVTFFRNTPTITIAPTVTGLYSFSVTAISATTLPPTTIFQVITGYSNTTPPALTSITTSFYYTNTGLYIFNNIPQVTAIPVESLVYLTTSFSTPTPGFVLTTPLYGWDYNTNSSSDKIAGNIGARPFWAKVELDKNTQTDYKGIDSWGNYITFTDQHNFIVQPTISDIVLTTGSYIEYKRSISNRFVWEQPINVLTTSNKRTWSTLEFNTSGTFNISKLVPSDTFDLVVLPTTKPSTLTLESIVENEPVEIHYNAVNPFVWSVTAIPQIQETVFTEICAQQITNISRPWNNFIYRNYPNVAVLPTIENLSGIAQIGGIFTPTNLGVTQYLNRDFTTGTILTSVALSGAFDTSKLYFGGRGVTKQDQLSPYEITSEDSIWLKEPAIATSIAGTIKKDIFKKYQKFIPYQSKFETNPRSKEGIITPSSRLSPWTGPTNSDWGDVQNYPLSFTGELNVDNWSNSQILKNTNLLLDNWITDIFGNQYGLYKDIKSINPQDRKTVGGEIWVRKNSQIVSPGYVALSGIFDTYKNTTLYKQLTGRGITHLDIFSDIMYVQTSGTVIFERLFYEYNNDYIFSLTDDTRAISLEVPVQTNLNREFTNSVKGVNLAKAGEVWYIPDQKNILLPICGLSGTQVFFELYNYNINSLALQKVFPISQDDIISLNSLSSLQFSNFSAPVLAYNKLKSQFVLTILCQNLNNLDTIIELSINNFFNFSLENITIYEPTKQITQIIPPVISQQLYRNQSFSAPLLVLLNTSNGPAKFEGINLPSWASLTTAGVLSGNLPSKGYYTLPFVATNEAGPAYYSYTIDAT